jgi:predicted small integral membrane protein
MQVRRSRAALATVLMLVGLAAGWAMGESWAQTATDTSDTGSSLLGTSGTAATTGATTTGTTATDLPTTDTTTTGTTATQAPAEGGTQPPAKAPGPAAAAVGVGMGDASQQGPKSKWREAARSCKGHPQHSELLAVKGLTSERDHRWLTWTIVAITVAAGAVALVAVLARRRRGASPATPRKAMLELVATMVAIAGTLAGLASAFIPGVGVRERPAPEVTMTVREVHASITHGDYLAKTKRRDEAVALTRGRLLSSRTWDQLAAGKRSGLHKAAESRKDLDRLEIGDVAWIELSFTGYRGEDLTLQWALFHPEPGAPLIPDTEGYYPIEVTEDGDHSSQFIPIWFGLPVQERFRTEFRVMNSHKELLQMASTEAMKGSGYRYACPEAR